MSILFNIFIVCKTFRFAGGGDFRRGMKKSIVPLIWIIGNQLTTGAGVPGQCQTKKKQTKPNVKVLCRILKSINHRKVLTKSDKSVEM